MRNLLKIVIAVTVLLSLTIITAAQNQPLAFEVASVKPSKVDASSSGINSGNGRIYGYNVTLKRCIMGAYAVGPNEIISGPDWLDSERFEITAKAEEPVGDRVLMTMLQTLLAERFKLELHREAKPTDAYVLEITNKATKLEHGDGQGATTNNGRGHIVATNASMDRFAEILSRQMDRPVVNRTGLNGVFNLTLQWTPDGTRPAKADDGAAIEGPSIFTAIQEQLGLRLRAQRVPIEVLVIDHAEKPVAN
jgi:uncharacterized protein (TIGR03435 family)